MACSCYVLSVVAGDTAQRGQSHLNYQANGSRGKWIQLLEVLFFVIVTAAFVLLIPMKARAGEKKFHEKQVRGQQIIGLNETGEKKFEGDSISEEELAKVLNWSYQIPLESD
ncbi:MAG: hypothetical protein ACKOA8_15860 [Deltaproteobacteria bacterium]